MDKFDLFLILITQGGLIIFAVGSIISELNIYKRLRRLEESIIKIQNDINYNDSYLRNALNSNWGEIMVKIDTIRNNITTHTNILNERHHLMQLLPMNIKSEMQGEIDKIQDSLNILYIMFDEKVMKKD